MPCASIRRFPPVRGLAIAAAGLFFAARTWAGPEDTVLFHLDFSHDATGPYSLSEVKTDFHNPAWVDGLSDGLADIVDSPARREGKSLRVRYPAGRVGAGVIIPVALPRAFDELYLSYAVYFPDGFTFVKEGKLSGLCGGACNSGGHRPDGRDGWSSRIIWRKDRPSQYNYDPDQADIYGDIAPWAGHFTTGSWHTVQMRVKMNTPGQADGEVESWLDGTPAYRDCHVRWRNRASLAIDSFRFETFFGGGSADFAPATDQYAYFTDITVSTRFIGKR